MSDETLRQILWWMIAGLIANSVGVLALAAAVIVLVRP